VKQIISLGAVDYIVDYVAIISQKPQVDVLVVNWVNNIHGVVFGIAA